MRHVGTEPPWTGRSRYGSWRRVEENWFDIPEWEYVGPPRFFGQLTSVMSDLLKDIYLDTVRESLSSAGFVQALTE